MTAPRPTALSLAAGGSTAGSQRAVGFVNFDARGTRDSKRPCIIFLLRHEQFGRPAASLVLYGVAQRNLIVNLCNVPPTVTQHFIQQVHMSTTGEYVAFTVAEAANPEGAPRMPMLFHRTGQDLRACDHFIDHGQDLNGDQLQSFYFPQFTNVGEVGSTWVLATCRTPSSGARCVHLVKLQHPDKVSFFSGFFGRGRNRRVGAHTVRHIPGTDLILTCTHKMAPNNNVPVRHFAVHAVTASEQIERLYEVQLCYELSLAQPSEQLLGGYVFYEGSVLDEMRYMRETGGLGGSGGGSGSSSGSGAFGFGGSSSSKGAGLKFNCVVVAYILHDQAVKASVCGAQTREMRDAMRSDPTANVNAAATSEYVLMNVVRLFVFRPRSAYQGHDYYIDLFFERRNIAVFQISAQGQMVVLSPGYKAYFVDVKYFHPDVGPTVSYRLYLDGQNAARNFIAKQHLTTTATGAGTHSSSAAVPIPQRSPLHMDPSFNLSGGGGSLIGGNTLDRTPITLMSPLEHVGSIGIAPPTPHHVPSAAAAAAASSGSSTSQQQQHQAAATTPVSSPHSPPSNATTQQQQQSALPFEEGCFVGDKLPDCFLRLNCLLLRLQPIEVMCGDQGKYIVFFSTHTPAVLALENRGPVWTAAQQALLRDRLRKPMHAAERCHDGEFSARGLLSVMDRVAMSLAFRNLTSSSSSAAATGPSSTSSPALLASATPANNTSIGRFPGGARSAEEEDTIMALKALVPVFQAGVTRMRDPIGLCLEWIVAAAYFRLGRRHNAPPRLGFDFAYYEGIIHPHGIPRTTQHVRGSTMQHSTWVVSGSGSGAAGGGSGNHHHLHGALGGTGGPFQVIPRDEFVKAVENRIDEAISCREQLIRGFREFGLYEEAILECVCSSVLHEVRSQLFPTALPQGAHNNNNSDRSRQFSVAHLMLTTPTTSALNQQQQQQQSSNANAADPQQLLAQANANAFARRVPVVPRDVRLVNELCFLLCRLTALEVLGVRLDNESKSPIVSTAVVFFAANNGILPYTALTRAMWLRSITNHTASTADVLSSPLSKFANEENRRLNILVDGKYAAQKKRRFLPSVNPSSAILAPLGNSAGGATIPASDEADWDDEFACVQSQDARSFIRGLRKKFV